MTQPNPHPDSASEHPLRVFVSSHLQELAEERLAAREAIQRLKLLPILFEMGARPHPPQALYRTYLQQSQVFIGIYWQRYGWIAPNMSVSGVEDEYQLCGKIPKLIYIKQPAPEQEPRLTQLLEVIRAANPSSHKFFSTPDQLKQLISSDLALLTEHYGETALLPEAPPASHLPTPMTSLIGRDDEILAVRQILEDPAERMVTLVGPGGVGKTRIALEVARQLEPVFAEGAYFVSLATLSDPGLVAQTIARAFGVIESSTRSLLEGVIEFLREKQVLLLLDGFETVLEATPVVAELLAQIPRLKVLITSRAVLRLYGERDFQVLPLQLPAEEAESLEQLAGTEAVRLFVERARMIKPDFTLTPQNAATVAEICRRLDGLPLAIELAAVRIKLLQPKALLERLSSRLTLLTEGPRDLPARQRTLRDTMEWSFRLLSPHEQTLFSRMAVLVEGGTLEALEEVCAEADDPDLLERLVGLVEKSLVIQRDTASEPRFSMLETIREFALEKLEQSGQGQMRRQKHAEYFLELAAVAHAGRMGATQLAWLERLEAEQGNHRAALAWFVEQGQAEPALRLVASLRWFWDLRGRFSEARRWFQAALNLGGEVPPLVRAAGLMGAGVLAWRQGDYATARPLMEESLNLRRLQDDKEGIANALQNLGNLATHLGDFDAARVYQDENILIRRQLGDKDGIADALFSRGNVALVEGQLSQAKALYQESLTLYGEVGDTLSFPFVLVNLAEIARFQGDYKAAQAQAEEAKHRAEQVGDRLRLANALQSLGLTARDQAQPETAQQMLEQSLAIYRELGHGLKIGFVSSELGTVMLQKGDLPNAQRFFSEGLKTHQGLGLGPGIAYGILGLAETARARGESAEALRLVQEGLPIAHDTTDNLTQARYLETLALLPQTQPEAAVRFLSKAEALRKASEIVQTPAERPALEAGLQALRAKLEPQTFTTLWAEGQALRVEEVIATYLSAQAT